MAIDKKYLLHAGILSVELDYVSCSGSRVPVVRLAETHAALKTRQ